MTVAKHAQAYVQDDRPVPVDQGLEGRLVPHALEPLQKLAIGQPGERADAVQGTDELERVLPVVLFHHVTGLLKVESRPP